MDNKLTDYDEGMSGVRGELSGDRSKKRVTRTGTTRASAYLNNWKYGVELILCADSTFEIYLIDEITKERFTVIRADGKMIDWIMHNFLPEEDELISPFDFNDDDIDWDQLG